MGVFNRFDKVLSFDPKNIKDMSMSQKREIIDEIEARKSFSMKYSGFFVIGVIAYFFLNSMIAFWSFMRDLVLSEFINPAIIAMVGPILLCSLFACTIKKSLMIITLLLYAVIGTVAVFTGDYIIIPFAFFGCFVYYRLMEICEAYNTLSKEKGFPDFHELSSDLLRDTKKSEKDKDEE